MNIFQGQGKVREFFKKSGKIFDIVKVSEKSGNSVFWFIVHNFSSRFWNAFSFGKDKKYGARQEKRSIDTTSDTCGSCDQWFSLWMLSCKFLLPLSAQSRKSLKMKRKLLMAPKKAKVNGNMDCFSLIKDQWKRFKGQWKVGEFLTFWWVATLVMLRWPQFWLIVKNNSPKLTDNQ